MFAVIVYKKSHSINRSAVDHNVTDIVAKDGMAGVEGWVEIRHGGEDGLTIFDSRTDRFEDFFCRNFETLRIDIEETYNEVHTLNKN